MKRAAMERREKDLLSNLTRLINYSEYIHANLTVMERVCGNKNCKCIREGKKHVSLYLTTVKKDGKRNMIYIPKKLEDEVKAYTERFFKIKEILEEVAAINLERLLGKKKADV
ncbi:MAG: DUF6788 family protein [Candidatus Humimicrobiaceae bacterium]